MKPKDILNQMYGAGLVYQDTDTPAEKMLTLNPIKFKTIKCDFFALQLTDGTISDFQDCAVRSTYDGIEILTSDNLIAFYYSTSLLGYTYRAKPYDPQKID